MVGMGGEWIVYIVPEEIICGVVVWRSFVCSIRKIVPLRLLGTPNNLQCSATCDGVGGIDSRIEYSLTALAELMSSTFTCSLSNSVDCEPDRG